MIQIGLSTASLHPHGVGAAFRLARRIGYDGIEVMVTHDPRTQDATLLRELSFRYRLPILSIHAPVLVLTQFVWSRDPAMKLARAAELAREVGAKTVVAHPPYRWQPEFARRFESVVAQTEETYGVEVAVENMFPLRKAGLEFRAYAPSADPTELAVNAMTLDFSHASLAGRDSLEYAMAMGSRLRHVHLSDGGGRNTLVDEHLVPGHGTQPVAEVLQLLGREKWKGAVIAEVHTRSARSEAHRVEMLTETLEFARSHVAAGKARRPRKTKRR
jgi:sugar phosphate isomerase/epimerase